MARETGGNGRVVVAVIGAGIMGSAMARNLAAAGLTTRVWDRTASATGPLADAGVVVAPSAPDHGRHFAGLKGGWLSAGSSRPAHRPRPPTAGVGA